MSWTGWTRRTPASPWVAARADTIEACHAAPLAATKADGAQTWRRLLTCAGEQPRSPTDQGRGRLAAGRVFRAV
jgi:hypothetical protein